MRNKNGKLIRNMKNRKAIIFSLIITLFITTQNAWACTTFNLQGKGFNLVGHNYDWPLGNGLVFINKSGKSKVAMLASKNEDNFKGQPAQWTSKYGSVTFNQYGCDLAHGGMNEAGLVIEAMALYDTIYPEPGIPTPQRAGNPSLIVGIGAEYLLNQRVIKKGTSFRQKNLPLKQDTI